MSRLQRASLVAFAVFTGVTILLGFWAVVWLLPRIVGFLGSGL